MKENRIPRANLTPDPNPGGNNDWMKYPNSTQEIADLFHLVRRNQEGPGSLCPDGTAGAHGH